MVHRDIRLECLDFVLVGLDLAYYLLRLLLILRLGNGRSINIEDGKKKDQNRCDSFCGECSCVLALVFGEAN